MNILNEYLKIINSLINLFLIKHILITIIIKMNYIMINIVIIISMYKFIIIINCNYI